MGININFSRPDGSSCSGHYIKPVVGDSAPGIVVIQEWWGLNNQIKGVGERLANAGYRALIPDLYRGSVTLDSAEANHLMENLDFGDAAKNDIAGAVAHLKRDSRKVGVVGFCMGGALTVLAGVFTEADAAVSWYGFPPEEAADVTQMRMPLQGHFALEDTFFPPEAADSLDAKLEAAGKPHEFYRYQAGHAFGNETGGAYNKEATEQAWGRTMEFFQKYLR